MNKSIGKKRKFSNQPTNKNMENVMKRTYESKPDDLCFCGSGKKYKKCCVKYDKADTKVIVLTQSISKIITNAIITNKEGSTAKGYAILNTMNFHEFLFDLENEKDELSECINNWDLFIERMIDKQIIPQLRKTIVDGRFEQIESAFLPSVTDENYNEISEYANYEISTVEEIKDVIIKGPLDVTIKHKNEPEYSLLTALMIRDGKESVQNTDDLRNIVLKETPDFLDSWQLHTMSNLNSFKELLKPSYRVISKA